MTGMQPQENPPPSWEAAAVDDHGNPAVWMECDACGRRAWCLSVYGVDPWLRWLGHYEGCALEWDEFGYGCDNCVPVLAFCVDTEACHRAQGLPWPPPPPPPPVPRADGRPPWAEGGEDQ
jgi:hypothetical protein